jgi:hypothetical protein
VSGAAVRRPVWALHVLVVGLALHNIVMAELWDAGVRGTALDVVSAWKEVLLAVALVLAVWAQRRLPFDGLLTDWLALAFGALVVVYAVLPQGWLDGGASDRGVVLGLRHDGLAVATYFLGRALILNRAELRRLCTTILATAAGVAAFGLVDVYLIPLQWWRDSGAPGWFTEQLGFAYRGLSGLPENFVYNPGNEEPLRRLVSTFLSPLAASYMFVVALLITAAWLERDRLRGGRLALWFGLVALLFAGLLWTHTRSSYLALAVGLVVYALARGGEDVRARVWLAAAAVAVVGLGSVFVAVYTDIGPATTFTEEELVIQRADAEKGGEAVEGISDASTESHWASLRAGIRTVVRHPQGYGLGNAGSTATRTDADVKAGESTYTELGVETGLVGGLVFIAWSVALAWRVLPRSALVGSMLVAMLALGLQTDILGVPWIVYVVWALAGSAVSPVPEE